MHPMATVPKLLSPRGEATRARILAAAVTLVAERGVAAVTLDHVQAQSGVSRGQLYHYFDGREALLLAVVHATADTILERQAEAFSAMDTWAGVDGWLDLLRDVHTARGPLGCPLGGLVSQLGPIDEASRVAITAGLDRWEGALREGFIALHARGELDAGVDPGLLATTVMACVQGAYLLAQSRRDTGQFDRALDGVRQLLAQSRRAA